MKGTSSVKRSLILVLVCLSMSGQQAEEYFFTLVVLPDTQNYTVSNPDIFYGQTEWIAASRDSLNTVFVTNMGDMVQNIDENESEWLVADSAYKTLELAGIPYGVLPGNHDISDSYVGAFFDSYFNPSRFDAETWYGSYMGEDLINDPTDRLNQNSYQLFSAGGMDFISLQMSNLPDQVVRDWADRILELHSDRRAIVSTHQYIDASGGIALQSIWDEVINPNCNVFLVMNGHYFGAKRRSDLNSCGQAVHQVLQNYQGEQNGGDGWLRYFKFFPASDKIEAWTYSPTRFNGVGDFWYGSDNRFELDYDMIQPVGPPSVSFVYPSSGSVVSPGLTTLQIAAQDIGLGTVEEVTIRRGNLLLGEAVLNSMTGMYELALDLVEGFYQLEASVKDDDDNVVESSVHIFDVALGPPVSPDVVALELFANLQGAFEVNDMRADLLSAEYLPAIQPYLGVKTANVPGDFYQTNNDVVDWIILGIREEPGAETVVEKWPLLLRKNGRITDVMGNAGLLLKGIPHGDYYLTVEHRNHLSVMTSEKLSLSKVLTTVDFRSSAGFSIGDAAQSTLGPSIYGLWSGDGNDDGELRYSGANNDRVGVLTEAGGPSPFDFSEGYSAYDYNLDGVVRYSGAGNERVDLLSNVGGPSPFDVRTSQVPR